MRIFLSRHSEDELGEVLLFKGSEEGAGGNNEAVLFRETVSCLESSLGIEKACGDHTDFILEPEEFDVSAGFGTKLPSWIDSFSGFGYV